MDDLERRTALAAVLAWNQAMGVDAAVSDDAVDWLSRGETAPGISFDMGLLTGHDNDSAAARAPAKLSSATPAPTQRASLLPPSQTARTAPAAAVAKPASPAAASIKANSLADLADELKAFDGCGLKATATSLCFYRGAERARLMIIGEAPGREEDLAGKPFVGAAGQLLDKMLSAAGFSAEQVHITNVVYWRPPGNRTPSPAEGLACAPFLTRQIELVSPDVILLLGAIAAKQILDTTEGILRLRGNWFETVVAGRTIKTMPSLHPAYVLRTPTSKRQAWRDFLAVKAMLC
jgi:uracil-DNA glycosylase